MRAKFSVIFLCLLLLLMGVSCAGEPPEGSVLYYSSWWGEKPNGTDSIYRQLHIEAAIQNVGGEGAFWVNAEIMEKGLLMEGPGVQNIKVYMEQGEQQTYQFNFWLDPTQTITFSIWCSDKPGEISSDLGNLQFLILGEGEVVLGGAKVASNSQPEGQMKVAGDTKSDGTVAFNNVKAGEYTFYVSMYGYERAEFNVTVEAGLTTSTTVTLAGASSSSTTTVTTTTKTTITTTETPMTPINTQPQQITSPDGKLQILSHQAVQELQDDPMQTTISVMYTTVYGVVKNISSSPVHAEVKVEFYGKGDIGVFTVTDSIPQLQNIPPGATRTFSCTVSAGFDLLSNYVISVSSIGSITF